MSLRRASLALFAILVLPVLPAQADDPPSASGLSKGHQLTSFSAMGDSGDATGHIYLAFRDANANFTMHKVHAHVVCLSIGPATFDGFGDPVVAEKAASIVGLVDRSANPFIAEGELIELEVADLGPASPGHDFGPDWTGTIVENPPPEPQWMQGETDEPDCVFNGRDHHRLHDGNIQIEGQA